jgi:tRNA(Ile2) C34 agmatinyltransferase TiaS|tara:strand:+ start:318 stop:548 length:231 start_codon:yes stop_codon:yes gene_type:complete
MSKKMIFQTEIVTGKCPECVCNTILIGFDNSFYRCTNCGSDLEQKVNGHIKYMPIKDRDTRMTLRVDDWDDDGKKV